MLKTLFSPLRFLKIKFHCRWGYLFLLPGCASLALIILYYKYEEMKLVGTGSLVEHCSGLMRLLAGFYFAGLGLVVSLSKNEWLEMEMKGEPPPTHKNSTVNRRFFLSHMFGYLAFLSIFVYLLGLIASIVPHVSCDSVLLPYSRLAFVGVYAFLFTNVIVTTIIGIYFFGSDSNTGHLVQKSNND
jgi:hypothetical protein